MTTIIIQVLLYQSFIHNNSINFVLQSVLSSYPSDDSHFTEDMERHLIYSVVWACGGFLTAPNKTKFDLWWRTTFNLNSSEYCYPKAGTVWDYYTKPGSHTFFSWINSIPPLSLPLDKATPPFVHTARSVAVSHFINSQIGNGCPVLLNGQGGSGKTALLKQLLKKHCKMGTSEFNLLHVYCNLLTSAEVVWNQVLDCLDWDWGKKYMPRGSKKLICFIDDLHNTGVRPNHNFRRGILVAFVLLLFFVVVITFVRFFLFSIIV